MPVPNVWSPDGPVFRELVFAELDVQSRASFLYCTRKFFWFILFKILCSGNFQEVLIWALYESIGEHKSLPILSPDISKLNPINCIYGLCKLKSPIFCTPIHKANRETWQPKNYRLKSIEKTSTYIYTKCLTLCRRCCHRCHNGMSWSPAEGTIKNNFLQ